MGALALIVRAASPGPAFYSQIRLGRNGRTFRIFKLRTMADNCEQATGPIWSHADDPRVTRLGRLLRDTHLDELPQLWNVLRGDMSLIGPRPERPEIALHIEGTLPEFPQRLQIRPGMTGFAQLRMSPNSTLAQISDKLAHDLYYIENLTLVMDLRIAAATIFKMLGAGCAAASSLLMNFDQTERRQTSRLQIEQPSSEPLVEMARAAVSP